MKTQNIYFALLLNLISIASCNESERVSYETKVVTTVCDDENKPVADVKVTVTHDFLQQNEKTVRVAHTNSSGQATTSAISLPGLWIRTQSANYYPTFEEEISNLAGTEDYAMKPLKNLHHTVVIRKIKNPIALYAKNIDTPIPDNKKWIGFDLEKADWLKPYGKGVCNDLEFFLTSAPTHVNRETVAEQNHLLERILKEHSENAKQKSSYVESRDQFYDLPKGSSTYDDAIKFRLYKWEGTVQMRVPHVKGGIIAEKEQYLFYAKYPQVHYAHDFAPEMRLPHHAPKDGYRKEYKWEKSTKDGSAIDEKLGFFIKTRVKLDEKGNEISAHYAKFITDLEIDIRGRIKFTSYFNPTPNDTNLEFDLKKNLFKNLKDSEKPFLP
jgi:hypothetical protein